MITILSALLGFFSSSLPTLFQYFQDRADKKQELAILQIQVDLAKCQLSEKLQEVGMQQETQQLPEVYQAFQNGNPWIDGALQGTRILVTFILLGMYCFMQHMYYMAAMESGLQDFTALAECFTNEDQALLTMCLSFFFGHTYFNQGKI